MKFNVAKIAQSLLAVTFFLLVITLTNLLTRIHLNQPAPHSLEPKGPFKPTGDLPRTLRDVWTSTIWIGREAEPGVTAYVQSGWVIGSKEGRTYIATAEHGLDFLDHYPLVIGYWNGKGSWVFEPAQVVATLNKNLGDIAILSIGHRLPALPLAHSARLIEGDEIVIGGVQHDVAPAYATIGIITEVKSSTFLIRGWAWFGFSGGPVVLRRTGEVIGWISSSVPGHTLDATYSRCQDYSNLRSLLKSCDLDSIN